MKVITRRHRIGTIEDILNIRCDFNLKEGTGQSIFKVYRFNDKANAYIYDGVYTKDALIAECNRENING